MAGALLSAAALVCAGGQAVVLASATPPAPAAGTAGVIPASRFYHQDMTAGDIYTVAGGGHAGLGDGGPAARAEFANPADIALSGQGNLIIADAGHNRVRAV